MADFQNQIDIQDLAIKLAAMFTTPVPLSPANLPICVDMLDRSCFFLFFDNSLQSFLASSSSSSLSPRMSWSRLFNRQFSSLRRRISWVLGSSSTDEFELMLRLRFGFKRCSRPFSGSDLLEIWEGTSELSDKLPSPHSNIVRCYKQCTCVLMWQQISGKALRCTALAIQITRQLWSIPHFGICVIIQIVFCISYLESRPILSWRNKLARLYIDACNNIIACFLKYVTPLTW